MDLDGEIELVHLECVGTKKEKHFLENPVLLQCGHFMCCTCAHNEKINEDTVRCAICEKDRTVNFEMNQATIVMNNQIKACLGQLFDVVQEKCNSKLSKLKCK